MAVTEGQGGRIRTCSTAAGLPCRSSPPPLPTAICPDAAKKGLVLKVVSTQTR